MREGLNKFFDFMSADKRGLYLKLDGKTIKDFMNTEVSDEVKFLLDTEISGLDKTSKNEVFNSYPDLADNYNKFTEDKVRLKAVQRETEAVAKAGEKTADQYKKVKADIAKQNDVLAKMSVKEITSNKELLNSVRMSINSKTGDVSYTNYTANDPKGKPALTDLELAEKIKQKAKDKNFYVTEHIGKKSLNKTNLAFPNNIQSANYMSNSQLENARRFLINPENRNTPAAQNLDKTLEDLKLTIRGPEYGGKPIGNKIPIVFDSKTGISNIVEDQLLNNKKSNAPTFSSNPMADPSMLKKYGKYALQVAGTPLGAGVLTAGFGVDPTSAIDRSALAAEAAFAPALVKGAKQVATTPGMQRILNLGLSPKMAMRAARIASPIGIATLAGEGIYQGGKYMLERKELLESLTDEQRDNLLSRERSEAIQQNRRGDPEAFSGIMAANGGLISREGFEDGSKDPKMNRRTFMKVMGGLASIPLLGKFMKPAAKVVESAAPVIQRSVEGVPEFLMDLIAKVKLKAKTKGYEYFTGNKPEEFKDVYQVDNYVVTEKGNKTIIREIDQDGDMLYKENQMELDYDPETGGYTYNEASARPDAEGKLKDVEEYIEDDDLENMRKYTYDE